MKNLSGIVGIFLLIFLIHSCEKDDKYIIKDVDGNVYTSVTIGTQIWMVENFKATKYNDGTAILNVADGDAWNNLSTPAFCWYNNDVSNKATYGALYNWYAVNTGKLCPIGWHVPTETEWSVVINYLGGANIAGGKLKEVGLSHWKEINVGATNESGFTALPGGLRSTFGDFGTLGIYGRWWSSTAYSLDPQFAVSMNIDDGSAEAYIEQVTYEGNGESVRCLKD